MVGARTKRAAVAFEEQRQQSRHDRVLALHGRAESSDLGRVRDRVAEDALDPPPPIDLCTAGSAQVAHPSTPRVKAADPEAPVDLDPPDLHPVRLAARATEVREDCYRIAVGLQCMLRDGAISESTPNLAERFLGGIQGGVDVGLRVRDRHEPVVQRVFD